MGRDPTMVVVIRKVVISSDLNVVILKIKDNYVKLCLVSYAVNPWLPLLYFDKFMQIEEKRLVYTTNLK